MDNAISITTSVDYSIPIDVMIPLLHSFGFSYFSLGGQEKHSRFLSKDGRDCIKRIMESVGMQIDTIHCPRLDQIQNIEQLREYITAANELSVKTLVFHGGPFNFNEKEQYEREKKLISNCKEYGSIFEDNGIQVALENVMPGAATEIILNSVFVLMSHG